MASLETLVKGCLSKFVFVFHVGSVSRCVPNFPPTAWCFLSIDQNPILKQLKLLMCGFYAEPLYPISCCTLHFFCGAERKRKQILGCDWNLLVRHAEHKFYIGNLFPIECGIRIMWIYFISHTVWISLLPRFALPADKKTLILITFIAVVFPCGTLFKYYTISIHIDYTSNVSLFDLMGIYAYRTFAQTTSERDPWWYFSTWCFGLILTFLQHSVLLHFRAKTCQHKFSYHIFLKLSLLIDMSNSGLCLLNRSIWRNAKNGQSAVPFTSKPKHCLQYMPFKLWQKPYCTLVSTS